MAAQPKPLPMHQPSYLEGGGDHRMADDDRSQARRRDVSRQRAVLHGVRRDRGDGDSRTAVASRQSRAVGGDLQRVFHDAWDDDDLPGRDAAAARILRQLSDPAADRRARRRLSAAQCAELLAGSGRGNPAASRLDSRRTSRCRMVRLREPDRALLHARPRDRLVGGRSARIRHFDRPHRPQLSDDDHHDARAGHDLHAHADVHVVDAGDVDPDSDRVSGAHDRADFSALRSFLRHAFLHRIGRRDADSMAASVLAVRPSRSVHHGAAGLRDNLGSRADLLAQAAVRLSDDGVFDLPDRISVVRRVGTSHVRDRDGPGGGLGVRDHLDADRDSHRRQNFQLDRDRLGRLAAHDDRILFRARDDPRVHHRRTQRNHARVGADRSAADRLLLRRRAFSLRAVRRRDVRDPVGVLLLVAENQRPHARRAARQVALLADGHRLQPDIFPDAHSRDVGDAAAHLHLRRRHGLDASQPARDGRRVHSRHRVPAFLHQHFQKSHQRRARARRSVGRTQPRMVDAVAAAGVQLRDDSASPRPRRVVDSEIRARRLARRRGVHGGAVRRRNRSRASRRPSITSTCRRRRFSRWC